MISPQYWQAWKHRLAFVLSRKIELCAGGGQDKLAVESHRDRLSLDVSGLRRGLHFIRIRYNSDLPLMGPRLTWDKGEGEAESEVFIFENRERDEVFGTVNLYEDVHSLHIHPSRLLCQVEVESVQIRPITEFARNRIYGVAYVQWRMYGARWLAGSRLSALVDRLTALFQRRPGTDYGNWWRSYGATPDADLQLQSSQSDDLSYSPLISLVMPSYRPDLLLLRAAVDSVKAQTYANWQLCICDDGSCDPELDEYLASLAREESRVKVVRRSSNGNISLASNEAIAVADGSYVGFVDHDDELVPDALFRNVCALNDNPDLKILYSDEDHVAVDGTPLNGHFKPDWNYELLRSINYVCHFLLVERTLLQGCGGFRAGYEGAQDYDLLLRLAEIVQREQILHIPRVLYHWRAAPGSTAENAENKPYAAAAGVRALSDHVQRLGLKAIAEHSEINTAYRVRHLLPTPAPSVSIIIPTRNDYRVLSNCMRSIDELTDYPNYEVVVVDNDSDEPETLALLESLHDRDHVRVLRHSGRFNYSAINNRAVSTCDSDVVLLLNNDIEVLNEQWLLELASQAARPEVGAVGAKLLFANDRIQHAGIILGLGGDRIAGHAFKGRHRNEVGSLARTRLVQEYNAVTGACLAVSRSKFEEVGGLDEANLAVAYNDVDLCLRLMESGYINIWTPYAQLYHFQSYSRGADSEPDNIDRYTAEAQYMRQRWGARLSCDQYYNPNLSRGLRTFELSWPPSSVG